MKYFFTLVALLLPSLSVAVTVDYISNNKVSELQRQFYDAKAEFNIEDKNWSCRLYGMRTRTIMSNPLNLYKLSLHAKVVKNSGVHATKHYQVSPQGLVAKKNQYQDVIRMTKDRKLIAEFSVPKKQLVASQSVKSAVDKNRAVVSYAICD